MNDSPLLNDDKEDVDNHQNILPNHTLKSTKSSKVGFFKIANQIFRKFERKDYQLNLMILGSSGLGKRSLINSLFRTEFPQFNQNDGISEDLFQLEENGIKLLLKIISYRDYDNKIDNSQCCSTVDSYLDQCFVKQYNLEYTLDFDNYDNLVHVCLYFLRPYNQDICLREIDLEFLKSAHNKVNIIPIIAKSDSMTTLEIEMHKVNLTNELKKNSIKCFQFEMLQDLAWKALDLPKYHQNQVMLRNLIDRYPFAVIGANNSYEKAGKHILIRNYSWGQVEIDNLEHCDTSALRTLLLSTHLQTLITTTYQNHYEAFVSRTLTAICSVLEAPPSNLYHPCMYLENVKVHHTKNLQKKTNDTQKGFEQMVNKKEREIQQLRERVEEGIHLMDEDLKNQNLDYDRKLDEYLKEKSLWSDRHGSVTSLNSTASVSTATLKRSVQTLFKIKKMKN